MIRVPDLIDFHHKSTIEWHELLPTEETSPPWNYISNNHLQNFLLWHEEDIARRDDLEADRIKQAKRSIDTFNQSRNNAMERIDDWILTELQIAKNNVSDGRLHSETPGMMIDRLSIMALKLYHMREQVDRVDATLEHREKCAKRVNVLVDQIQDLSDLLKILLDELIRGERRFKVYRQFKMYNDPDTNPQLYGRAGDKEKSAK